MAELVTIPIAVSELVTDYELPRCVESAPKGIRAVGQYRAMLLADSGIPGILLSASYRWITSRPEANPSLCPPINNATSRVCEGLKALRSYGAISDYGLWPRAGSRQD
jgi:hypothetical protein